MTITIPKISVSVVEGTSCEKRINQIPVSIAAIGRYTFPPVVLQSPMLELNQPIRLRRPESSSVGWGMLPAAKRATLTTNVPAVYGGIRDEEHH